MPPAAKKPAVRQGVIAADITLKVVGQSCDEARRLKKTRWIGEEVHKIREGLSDLRFCPGISFLLD